LQKQSVHAILVGNDVDGDEVTTRFRELLVAVKQHDVLKLFPSRIEHANVARLRLSVSGPTVIWVELD
jgi:hypothetical protein